MSIIKSLLTNHLFLKTVTIFKNKWLYILFLILFLVLPIQFTNSFFSSFFWAILFLSIPIALIIFFYKHFKESKIARFTSIAIIIITLPVFALLSFFSLFLHRTDTPLFINKQFKFIKIERMIIDEGAWGSDSEGSIVKVIYFFPGLRYYYSIDTSIIERKKWNKVKIDYKYIRDEQLNTTRVEKHEVIDTTWQ